ncbi:MAG: hypothetical protein ACXVJL_03770 [Candidatus Angelobacter sp.]
MLQKFLLPLGYFYLLRVPLLVWLFILFMFLVPCPEQGANPSCAAFSMWPRFIIRLR